MTKRELTAQNLLFHTRIYPLCQPEDIFKYLFHSAFGCEHMVASEKTAIDCIRKEAASGPKEALVQILDGGKYARVHLGWLHNGLTAQTLGRLFALSSKREEEGLADLTEKLAVAEELARAGEFPFSYDAFATALARWREAGYPPLHHSESYRNAYRPSYRVLDAKYVQYLPLLAMIDGGLAKGRLRLAIEGGSASGKTTLAALLQSVYGCAVVHTDDFFLQPSQRTADRLSQPGGNLDRERLLEEVLVPLSKGQSVFYRPFYCATMTLGQREELPETPLTVIEGAYSMHPELSDYYDMSVFLEVSPEEQARRIDQRNSPLMARRYLNEWIPMERRYFESFDIKKCCDLVL